MAVVNPYSGKGGSSTLVKNVVTVAQARLTKQQRKKASRNCTFRRSFQGSLLVSRSGRTNKLHTLQRPCPTRTLLLALPCVLQATISRTQRPKPTTKKIQSHKPSIIFAKSRKPWKIKSMSKHYSKNLPKSYTNFKPCRRNSIT